MPLPTLALPATCRGTFVPAELASESVFVVPAGPDKVSVPIVRDAAKLPVVVPSMVTILVLALVITTAWPLLGRGGTDQFAPSQEPLPVAIQLLTVWAWVELAS